MRRSTALLAFCALAVAPLGFAGAVCVTSGFSAGGLGSGTVCSSAPASASVRAGPTVATVSGSAGDRTLGTTGIGLQGGVPPALRVYLNGSELTQSLACLSNGITVGGALAGTYCQPVPVPLGATLVTKTFFASAYVTSGQSIDGRQLGRSGAEINYAHVPPTVHATVMASPSPSPSPSR